MISAFSNPPLTTSSHRLRYLQSAPIVAITGLAIRYKQRLVFSLVDGFNTRDRNRQPSTRIADETGHIRTTAKKCCPETMGEVQSMAVYRSHGVGRRSLSHYCGSKETCRWILIHQRL